MVFDPAVDLGIKLFFSFIEVLRDAVDEFLEFFFSLRVIGNPAIDLGIKLVESLMRVFVDLVHKLVKLVHELLMMTFSTMTFATMIFAVVVLVTFTIAMFTTETSSLMLAFMMLVFMMLTFMMLATMTFATVTFSTMTFATMTFATVMLAVIATMLIFLFVNEVGEEVKAIGLHKDIVFEAEIELVHNFNGVDRLDDNPVIVHDLDWLNINQNGLDGLFSDPGDIDFKVELAFLRDLFELSFDLIDSVLVLVNPVLGMGVDLLGCISDVIGELIESIRVLLDELIDVVIHFVHKGLELVCEVLVLSLAVGNHDQSQ